MKNPVLRARAIERLYQRVLRMQHEDAANPDPDLDPDERAERFVRSMSGSTQTLLTYHVKERHGHDAFEEFTWLLPPLAACIFSLEDAFMRDTYTHEEAYA